MRKGGLARPKKSKLEQQLVPLIDQIAEAVIRKLDEREKIDLIAREVLRRIEEQKRRKGRPSARAQANKDDAATRRRREGKR